MPSRSDEVGCSITDAPSVPTSRSLFRFFITDYGTKSANSVPSTHTSFTWPPSKSQYVLLRKSGMSLAVLTRIASFFGPSFFMDSDRVCHNMTSSIFCVSEYMLIIPYLHKIANMFPIFKVANPSIS